MESSMIVKSNKRRISLLIFSPLFLLTVGYFILNQQNIIMSIFNKYFSFTFTNVLHLLATDNWVSVLIQNAENMVINVGVFFLIEILVALIALIIIFFFLFKIRKKEHLYLGNKLVFSGYLLLLIGMFIIGAIAISATIQTFSSVQGIINGLRPSELQTISNEISTVLTNFSFSFNQIFKDLAAIFDQVKIVFDKVGQVGTIPGTLQNWWQGILSLEIYVIIVAAVSVISILTGHLMEIWNFIKMSNRYQNRKVKTKKESYNDRLLKVLEQQTQILEELSEEEKKANKKKQPK